MIYNPDKKKSTEPYAPKIDNQIGKVGATKGQKVAFVFFCIFTLGLFYIYKIVKMNQLKALEVEINEGAANIDVQLQKRFETLSKLVSAIKSQAKFDKETLESITKLRTQQAQLNPNSKLEELGKINKGINIAMEAYPNLGVDKSVMILMNEASLVEKEIAAARRIYNKNVTNFNALIFTFPINVAIANHNYRAIELFSAEEKYKKDVNLEF